MSCEINLICPASVTFEFLVGILRTKWDGVETVLPGRLEYQLNYPQHNLRIFELGPAMDVLDEYLDNGYFPEEIATTIDRDYRFFSVLYNDLDLAKDVLHSLLEKLVMIGKPVWFESDFGWFVKIEKLLTELGRNEEFSWLTEEIPVELL